MIITFSVKNFRSIRDKVCLDFRATSDKTLSEYYIHEIEKPKLRVVKMAMIYGKNASGKTNILLALSYMRKFVLQREKIEKEELIDVEAFALDREKNTEFEVQFVADGIVYNYTLIFNGIAIEYESLTHYPKGQEASVFERKLINLKEEPLYSYSWRGAELLQGQRKFLEITPHNRSIISGLGDIEYSGPIQKAREWFRETLDPIVEPKTSLLAYNVSRYLTNVKDDYNYRKFFIDQLKKADFMINDLEVKKEELKVSDLPKRIRILLELEDDKNPSKVVNGFDVLFTHLSDKESYVLEFENESFGTQRYFEFIGLMCELIHKNRIVSIDEIESSMHIDLQLHFIETFLRNSRKGQLIFTSHNTALLNEREILRRDAIWITDRKPDGSTSLTSVSEYPVRKEHAIDRLYRKGYLGGIPSLGSTLLENADENYEKKE